MTSWSDPGRPTKAARVNWLETGMRKPRHELVGFIAIACAVPVFFLGLFFALDALLRLVAEWIA